MAVFPQDLMDYSFGKGWLTGNDWQRHNSFADSQANVKILKTSGNIMESYFSPKSAGRFLNKSGRRRTGVLSCDRYFRKLDDLELLGVHMGLLNMARF